MIFADCKRVLFFAVLGQLLSATAFSQTAESYRERAIEFSRSKSWDQAIASYHKALDLEPNDPETHYNLALTLKYKGDAKQAVEEFETTLRLKPKWADAHYALGATWYDLNDQAAALKELRTAVDLDFANAGAHRLLAHIYLQQSNPSAAEGELRRGPASQASAPKHLALWVGGRTTRQAGSRAGGRFA